MKQGYGSWVGAVVMLGALGCAKTLPANESGRTSVSLAAVDASCDPEESWKCECVGTVDGAAASLEEIGVDLVALKTVGWPCVRGDFDQDGEPDYAFPGKGYSCNGAVPVRVLFTKGGTVRDVSTLPRQVSCLQRYGVRSEPGPNGTPPTTRQGLVDWGEGNATWVYLFDGKIWAASSYITGQ